LKISATFLQMTLRPLEAEDIVYKRKAPALCLKELEFIRMILYIYFCV